MTRNFAIRVLAAIAWVCAPSALAQDPAAAQRTIATSPSGPGSLDGVWVKVGEPYGNVAGPGIYDTRESVLKTADGTPLPTQPWATALIEKRLEDAEAGHPLSPPQARCLPPGVPDMMFEFGPMQILETRGQVTILRQEFTFFRIIHMTGTHPKDPDPTYMGHSIGHWEGDTLVVDTIGLTDKTTIKFFIPHSEDMHVIERYRRTGPDTLEIRATIEDPKTFTRPWEMQTTLKRVNGDLTEYICENNRNLADQAGNQVVVMPSTAR